MGSKSGESSHQSVMQLIEALSFKGKGTIGDREMPAERKARLAREDADASLERRKDWCLFVIVSALACVTAFTCLLASFLPWFTPEDKRWANSIVTTIVAAALSYWAGRRSKSA